MQTDFKNKNFKIRNAKDFELCSMVRLFDLQLGKKYITAKILEQAIKEKNNIFCKVVEDLKKNKIVGVCLYSIIDCEDAKEITHRIEIGTFKDRQQIGLIKTIAIDDNYKNLGLATNLIDNILSELESKNIKCFMAPAWKYSETTNIAHVLERNGFLKKTEIPDYWYESSLREGFECPKCGNPCNCSCVIYVKNI